MEARTYRAETRMERVTHRKFQSSAEGHPQVFG